ncbi:hypothetical protein [Petroclostridium sp. X23]|uniref:hypothetical protein n=1 Tax=Petroclostridium sp. X23 TaxID=3045146 RepID=UPI0024ADE8D1|nr:hypothetical protein [Petroclostridium sp. X23]WHH58330.1 hypothetical protein QKW49_21400 [Petroclostridium sp. X23]
MSKKYVSVMKWVAPIVTMALALIQLANIPFPNWLGVLLLIITAILYTVAFLIERKNNPVK